MWRAGGTTRRYFQMRQRCSVLTGSPGRRRESLRSAAAWHAATRPGVRGCLLALLSLPVKLLPVIKEIAPML
jgi:hypothetical protein